MPLWLHQLRSRNRSRHGRDLQLHRLPVLVGFGIPHRGADKKGSFKLLSGELKVYVKTGESGNKRPQSFCPNCGSPIYSTSTDRRSIRSGSARSGSATNSHQSCNTGSGRRSAGPRESVHYQASKSSVRKRAPLATRRQDRTLHSRYARGFAGLCGLRGGLYSSQME
jgi:hypothetical protein